ncbi:MAG: winged helix-turn-helix domain-containing protein [Terriglobia bacterium]|jgi:TolB-like protein/DNA-binding winged helix-turn-helix (wHTH) protein/Tfp pilus assembly protein PilF|nr:winged helix-turn-helix domain-containing protein [Terriglobia bacterium]
MAEPAVPVSNPIQFGVYTVDVRAGEISKHGTRIRLQDRPFRILLILLSQPGQLVTRDELRQQLWPDGTFVDFDRGISSAMNKLRSALGDTAANPKFIETVGRRGYRFTYPVTRLDTEQQPAPPSQGPPVSPLAAPSKRKWLRATVVSVLIVAAIAAAYFVSDRTSAAPIRSIAVLPLKNLSSSADEEFFSEGLSDELSTKLASLPGLRVISRDSVMQYKGSEKSLPEIAKELHVDGLVQGSVLRFGDKVRITVQLVQASTGRYLWAASYEREQRDVIELQNEVTRQIADNVRLNLNPADRERLTTAQTVDPQAHDDYLRGLAYLKKRTTPDMSMAAQYFEKAVSRDPGYAQAYAGLADADALLAAYIPRPPRENIEKARAAALKAIELDNRLAEAHTSLALIYQNYDWNWDAAEREYQRAIALDPNYATAHHWYAEFLSYMGRFDESAAEYARARQLDPFSLIIRTDYAVSLYYARKYDASVAEFLAVQAIDPEFPRAHIIADVYAQQERFDEAIADAQKQLEENALWGNARLARFYALAGQRQKAEQLLRHMEQLYGRDKTNPNLLIPGLIALGHDERAITLLERAYDQHYTTMTWLKVDPLYDPLRSNPRFQSLLKRVGLSQ